MKAYYLYLLLVLCLYKYVESYDCKDYTNYKPCEDWTICQRVRCAAPPNPCPKDMPYLLLDDCGCCQYCSKEPRIGPCGQCGKDVVCKEAYPICNGNNQTTTIDYCGCCRTCKTIVGAGEKCNDRFTVCASGSKCVKGICS